MSGGQGRRTKGAGRANGASTVAKALRHRGAEAAGAFRRGWDCFVAKSAPRNDIRVDASAAVLPAQSHFSSSARDCASIDPRAMSFALGSVIFALVSMLFVFACPPDDFGSAPFAGL
jgi:hypothetical protein